MFILGDIFFKVEFPFNTTSARRDLTTMAELTFLSETANGF